MKRILLILMLCFILSACGAQSTIDQPIPLDVVTAKEIEKLATPYVQSYWKNRKFHLGSINMILDGDQHGDVRLTYADESSEIAPHVVQVIVNTASHKIIDLLPLGADSKIDPGRIDFASWKIDSQDALLLAKESFGYPSDFKPDSLLIYSNNNFPPEDHSWLVTFQDQKKDEVHSCFINVFTGEVTSKETEKLHRGQTSTAP